jgi:uncharacterized protein YciI
MPVFHLVLSQTGPEFDPGKPLEEQSGWEEHAAFMEALVDDGFLILGGPIPNLRTVHAVEAESEQAVRERMARDPWSGSHLVIESVDPWTIRLDSRKR